MLKLNIVLVEYYASIFDNMTTILKKLSYHCDCSWIVFSDAL